MYIKHIELSHFKSFGGTAAIPLLPGFTVVSGPNGSGKSNILDALLFALGLAGSKGMRAERLPDLVNQSYSSRSRSTVEASVTVTFALDEEDLIAIRRLEHPGSEVESESEVEPEIDGDAVTIAPDPNNNGHLNPESNGHSPPAAESSAIDPSPTLNTSGTLEWSVTRKLRVTPQGTYTSNYAINDQPCTLTELHEQLQKFRIYPEGYNVVLQGDVTSIISMNPRERREIIDELAGVAAFDRKISQAKEKLDAVKDREERFRIVEKELIAQRDRLKEDRAKAEKYQRLRAELEDKSRWETVLVWRSQQQQIQRLQAELEQGDRHLATERTQLTQLTTDLHTLSQTLTDLNQRVKALGEDDQIALQAELATREAELRQVQRQEQDVITASQETAAHLGRTQQDIRETLQTLEHLNQEHQRLTQEDLAQLQQQRDNAEQALAQSRDAASAIASASDAGLLHQTQLRHQMETLLSQVEPQRTEQAALQERVHQLQQNIQAQQQALEAIAADLSDRQQQQQTLQQLQAESIQQVQSLAQALTQAEQERQIQQDTQARLLTEQRDKQRQLDRLEAQTQAQQEAQGTRASRLILQTGLPGVCGLVAQLGRVDPQYQLALEIAAGGRLGCLVVEDDGVAAAGIELLKQRQAGRATFLPLNKIRAPHLPSIAAWQRPSGWIDFARNLIDCDDRYRDIFAYIFGNTVVFATLADARAQMGQHRIVTLGGELLETSGAMTGGSVSQNTGGFHFGTVDPAESTEALALRQRLREIDRILQRCQRAIAQAEVTVKERAQALEAAREQQREVQLQAEPVQTHIHLLVAQEGQLRAQLSQNTQELTTAHDRLHQIQTTLPDQEAELQQLRQSLTELEQSQSHTEWQQIQANLRVQEARLNDRQLAVREVEHRIQDLVTQILRLQEKQEQSQIRVQEYRTQQRTQLNQRAALSHQQALLNTQIDQLRQTLATLEQTLAAEKQERDRVERQCQELQTQRQSLEWQIQKRQEQQQAQRQTLETLQAQLVQLQQDLPDPLPDIPPDLGLEQLQQQVRSLQKRIQAMEPVNMLALEEYERTQTRLDDLSQKLTTLEEERTELLLRIENFTTLRQRAFKEAFDAVNQNFQVIFAELSDGDGHLQLDDPQDPFAGGLNLVAHPKGKPVRRLASMSGGEKSLTALSFIFALQRYRPSSFYAFDEVDMFLDGANVERLAKMIKRQAQQAQFIVVSLRRPMIESAERTIGVTQARGAYTQVLGINLQSQSISG